MSDNNEKSLQEGYGKIKSPFLAKMENFFYHYKWHTIVALFIIFTLTVCIVQSCQKQSYDVYILYAGGTYVKTAPDENEESSHQEKLINASKRFTSDYDENGIKSVNFSTLYLPTQEQLEEIKSEDSTYAVNSDFIANEKKSFNQYVTYGNYYIILMSKSLYDEVSARGNSNPLAEISYYLPENYEEQGYVLAGEYGVYLSSTPLCDNPGFDKLGDDTVICIRSYSEIGTSKKSQNYHKNCEEIFRLMLIDKAAE